MQLLTATLQDYIEKHKIQTSIEARKEYVRQNMGNPLFGKHPVENLYVRQSLSTSDSLNASKPKQTQAEMSAEQT